MIFVKQKSLRLVCVFSSCGRKMAWNCPEI